VSAAAEAVAAVIRIGIDPNIDRGPPHLTWHGLMIALGS
jgi:hypothetical protein